MASNENGIRKSIYKAVSVDGTQKKIDKVAQAQDVAKAQEEYQY